MDRKLFCTVKVISLLSAFMWNVEEEAIASNLPGKNTCFFSWHLHNGTRFQLKSLWTVVSNDKWVTEWRYLRFISFCITPFSDQVNVSLSHPFRSKKQKQKNGDGLAVSCTFSRASCRACNVYFLGLDWIPRQLVVFESFVIGQSVLWFRSYDFTTLSFLKLL